MLEYKLLLLLTSANYQIPLSPWVVAPFAYSVQSRNFLALRDVWTMSIQVSSLRSPAWAPALLTPNLPLDRRFPPSLTPAPSCTHLASGVQSGRRGGAYRCPAGLFVPSSGWGCLSGQLASGCSACGPITWMLTLWGLLVGPSRGPRGFTSLPSPTKCVPAAGLPSLLRSPSSEYPRDGLSTQLPPRGPLHPRKHAFLLLPHDGGWPHLESQPQVFTSSRDIRSLQD